MSVLLAVDRYLYEIIFKVVFCQFLARVAFIFIGIQVNVDYEGSDISSDQSGRPGIKH